MIFFEMDGMPPPAAETICRPATAEADADAVFVIDAAGRVVAANASARRFWPADRALVGTPFPQLFVFEGASSANQSSAVQWPALRGDLLDRWASLAAVPLDGASRLVSARVERAVGGAGSYIAIVRPRNSHA